MAFRLGIATLSLGRAWVHQLSTKLDAAAANGIQGVEIFYEDLEYVAKELPGGLTDANRLIAAQQIRHMCDERTLHVICLQPLMHYEGLLDPNAHKCMIQKLKLFFLIAKELRTDIIQIPSNFLNEGTTGDEDMLVADLIEVADLGLQEQPPIRFAYENLCWGKWVSTVEQAWSLVAKVDRPNFGMCLDTFNIVGRAWADPSVPSGKVENADAILAQTVEWMKQNIDIKKIFYVEVEDAERLQEPLTPEHPFHVDGQLPRMSWSRNARLFPFEQPGYLPILPVLKAITDDLGFKGWISLEVFHRVLAEPQHTLPLELAQRAGTSWRKLVRIMGWNADARRIEEDITVDSGLPEQAFYCKRIGSQSFLKQGIST